MSVSFLAPYYNPDGKSYPMLIPSLLSQTDSEWELLVCSDGLDKKFDEYRDTFPDKRIKYYSTKERMGDYGHPIREMLIKESLVGRYTCLQNHDNMLVNTLVEKINNSTNDVLAWDCIHNYLGFSLLPCRLKNGGIDLGSLACITDIVKEIGFPWREYCGDWLWVSEIMKHTNDWKFLTMCGFVHQ
jgi:hypothetical protein